MSPDVRAQIIAKARSDKTFAEALRGPDAYGVIQEMLGVSLPEGSPLPEITPIRGLTVASGVRAGFWT